MLVALTLTQAFGFVIAAGLVVVSSEALPSTSAIAWSVVAGSSGIVGLAAFYLALSRGTMGIVAPLAAVIGATVPAMVGIAGGEPVNAPLVAGMLLAVGAFAVISIPDRGPGHVRPGGPNLPTFHGSRPREVGLIVVSGLGFAGFFLGIAQAHDAGGEVWWPLLCVRVTGLSLVLLALGASHVAGRLRDVRARRATLLVSAVAGAGDLGGNLFYLLASATGALSVSVVLSSLYPVQTALLARVFIHERLSRVRMLGVGMAVAGIALVTLGQAGSST
jgi:drug/metabolite transporter (DMT)-like permease